MKRIPVPDVSEGDRPEVTKIVDGTPTLEANRADADTTELESAIDEMVNDLNGMTNESGGGCGGCVERELAETRRPFTVADGSASHLIKGPQSFGN